ncbi:MAG: ketopantoate reductase family protein [Candidatus Limnocylindrales bacterium]
MRIAVIGAGAVGSVLAGCLASAGHRVVLVGRSGPPEPTLDTLELFGPGDRRRSLRVERLASSGRLPGTDLDAAVLAVKRYDLPEAAAILGTWPALVAVTVQNGVGAEELVTALRPGSPLVAASLTAAAELGLEGEVRWLKRGGIGLAPVSPEVPARRAARALASAFAAGGMPARTFQNAAAMKWSKLLANLVGNATSALLDLDVGAIYADRALFDVERRQEMEALAVMDALGLPLVALPGADVRMLVRAFRVPAPIARPILSRVLGGARGGKLPSLRTALSEAPAPTEVAWLNGAVASAAERLGVSAPVNTSLHRLVEEAAADPLRRAWFRGRPDRLLAELADAAAAG